MSGDTVINKWMAPSTDDKLKRRKSPGGRIMQGQKGAGRYSASILGNNLLLETIADSEKTTVYLKWSSFEKAPYLDEVAIFVKSEKTDLPSGTRLTITGGGKRLAEWNQDQSDKLMFELKKLMSPVSSDLSGDEAKDIFKIHLTRKNFLEDQEEIIDEDVEPYSIF